MSVSTSLRRIVRRSLKPLVMVGIAMTLALSLTVTTTQRAEATPGVAVAPVIAAAEGVLAGGVRLALPSLLSIAIATTPIGWFIGGGLALGALGVGLYSTRDYWLPFVAGAFGQGGNGNTPAAGSSIDPRVSITSATKTGSSTYSVQYATESPPSTQTAPVPFYISFALRCSSNADGTGTQAPRAVYSNSTYVYNGVRSGTMTAACTTGYLTGAVAGPVGGSPELTSAGPSGGGPKNVVRFGSYVDPTVGAFDPKGGDVKYKTTAECIDDGGNKTSITAEWFGDEGGAKIPSCAAAGKGHGTGKISVEGYAPTAPGVPGTVPKPIWDTQAPPADADHPLCGPGRPGPGCEMKIAIDGNPCVVGVWECENWSDLANDPATAPRVGCMYGPYTMALSACGMMEPAYRPGGAPATDANMDGNPSTRNYTQPGGHTYQSPQTGTGTAPGGFPTSGTNGNPEDPCLKDAWSWTPADWVKNPVVCALSDVFVPKQDIQARSEQLKQKAMDTVPIAWMGGSITGPGNSGCPNWTINVAGLSKNVICDSSFTQALLGVRTPLFGLVAAAMVWPLIRGIWYAAIPVLRVSPGSSK